MVIDIVSNAVMMSKEEPSQALSTLAKASEIAFRAEILILVALPLSVIASLSLRNLLFPNKKYSGSLSTTFPLANWRFIATITVAIIWASLEFALTLWSARQVKEHGKSHQALFWSTLGFSFASLLLMALLCWPKQLEKGAYEVLSFLLKLKETEGWSMSSEDEEVGSSELFSVSEQLSEE
jgi:hypothetical protein